MPDPMWTWCAAAGAARTTTLVVDINNYGDGYVHRSTRGLNPVRPAWTLSFPFRNLTELTEMDEFLRANAAAGFWVRPPDSLVDLFVTVDDWSASIIDRSGAGDKVGTLQVTFMQAFNPQPPVGYELPDADVWDWATASLGFGGPVSAARIDAYSRFVRAEKAADIWPKMVDYWMLWGENNIQSRVSLKTRGPASPFLAPVFTVDRGWTFSGSNYLNTFYTASTDSGGIMTPTNCRLASYERTNVSGGNVNCGASSGGAPSPSLWVGPRSGTINLVRANSSINVSYDLPSADSRGFTAVSLNGNTLANHRCWKNGVELTLTAGQPTPTFPPTLPAVDLYIGGANVNGVLTFGRPSQMGMVCYGASLTPAQEAAQYANVQALATELGAQVP